MNEYEQAPSLGINYTSSRSKARRRRPYNVKNASVPWKWNVFEQDSYTTCLLDGVKNVVYNLSVSLSVQLSGYQGRNWRSEDDRNREKHCDACLASLDTETLLNESLSLILSRALIKCWVLYDRASGRRKGIVIRIPRLKPSITLFAA